jgi:hypothetical protein
MPLKKCGEMKWRIGSGPCRKYASKEKALAAYRAYLAKRSGDEIDEKLEEKRKQEEQEG